MKKTRAQFSFRQVKQTDHQRIIDWLHLPHVNAFYYGEGLQNSLNNLALSVKGQHHNGRYAFYHWLALYDDMPIGFLMTSPVEGPHDPNDNYNKWYKPGDKMITLDVLIGEIDFVGKGLAAPMITSFITTHYSDMTKILIDPAQNNPKAVHVYEKAGFQKVDSFLPDFDPNTPHWMMLKEQA